MALIAPELIRSAVRIVDSSGGVWGTGFGYARPDDYKSGSPGIHIADSDEQWRLWFVTCAHVVDAIERNEPGGQPRICVQLNEVGTGGEIVEIDSPAGSWTKHKGWMERRSLLGPLDPCKYTIEDAEVDVAIAPAQMDRVRPLDWWGFPPKFHMTKALMKPSDQPQGRPLNEGDAVFILGFPVGYYADAKNWPVVRQGVLAQIQPYLEGSARTFLIDGSVFGGNSGGPVVTVPQALAITGTQQFKRTALLGMVSGCQLNAAVGENADEGNAFCENADLGIVVPLDTINEAVETALQGL